MALHPLLAQVVLPTHTGWLCGAEEEAGSERGYHLPPVAQVGSSPRKGP